MASDGPDRDKKSPALPRSPLAQPVEAEGPPDVPLPFGTPIIGGAVGMAAYVVHPLITFTMTSGIGATWSWLLFEAVRGALTGTLLLLGPTLTDRILPGPGRPARWAVGMGLGAFVTVALCAGFVRSRGNYPGPILAWSTAYGLAITLPFSSMMGAVLARAANSPGGLLWRLPVTGLAVRALMAVVDAMLYGLLSQTGADIRPLFAAPFLSESLLGALVGLVIAERLNAARRRAMEAGAPQPYTEEESRGAAPG